MKKAYSLLLVIPMLMACSSSKPFELVSGTYFAFNTLYDIRLFDGEETHLNDANNMLQKLTKFADPRNEVPANYGENVKILNEKGVIHVQDPLFFDLMKNLNSYQEITKGYFNPLMLNLSTLWKESLHNGVVPSQDAINSNLEEIRNSSLEIDEANLTIKLIGPAKIDLGAVAKGYSLDVFKDYFDSENVKHYLVNGGDSSIMVSSKPNGGFFTVGLRDIPGKYFEAKDEFVSTSSCYVQGKEVDGVLYSHIVNPFTGSAITEYDLVVIKGSAPSALMDAMSTAMSCMPLEDVKQLSKEYDLDVLLKKGNKIVYQSEGMEVKSY